MKYFASDNKGLRSSEWDSYPLSFVVESVQEISVSMIVDTCAREYLANPFVYMVASPLGQRPVH
jgi:hypothetical protein